MCPRSWAVTPRILIISPVRNEAKHIELVAKGVAAQTVPCAEWVVVDDSSTDETLEILRRLEAEHDFLHVFAKEKDDTPVVDRLARAAAPITFNYGLARAEARDDFTHIMKLDGDIEMPPDYFERILARYEEDPSLGMVGGNLIEPRGGGMHMIPIPSTHVHGAVKFYTRACWDAIGGIAELLGWDTIDETYARMRGFGTVNDLDIIAIHHRPHASADGTLRGRARHGQCAYVAHFSPLWVALRSVKIARSRPVGISGVMFFWGYVRSWLTRVEQVPDPEFRRFARRELRTRLRRGAIGVLPLPQRRQSSPQT